MEITTPQQKMLLTIYKYYDGSKFYGEILNAYQSYISLIPIDKNTGKIQEHTRLNRNVFEALAKKGLVVKTDKKEYRIDYYELSRDGLAKCQEFLDSSKSLTEKPTLTNLETKLLMSFQNLLLKGKTPLIRVGYRLHLVAKLDSGKFEQYVQTNKVPVNTLIKKGILSKLEDNNYQMTYYQLTDTGKDLVQTLKVENNA